MFALNNSSHILACANSRLSSVKKSNVMSVSNQLWLFQDDDAARMKLRAHKFVPFGEFASALKLAIAASLKETCQVLTKAWFPKACFRASL